MDVDGTLTDGKIYIGADGEIMKAFDIKDGYAIAHMLPKHDIIPVIITGRESRIVEYRAKELGISEIYQGKLDKLETLNSLMAKYHCNSEDMCYFGDDMIDIPAMKQCGIVGCPCDAVDEVKAVSSYICKHEGGHGAAREFIEWLIKQ